MSRVGSGRVIVFRNLTGRVGSGRVGSGRVKTCRNSRWSGRVMTREIRVTRGPNAGQATMARALSLADPWVEPADLACGFAIFKLTVACRRVLVVPAPRGGSDPRARK